MRKSNDIVRISIKKMEIVTSLCFHFHKTRVYNVLIASLRFFKFLQMENRPPSVYFLNHFAPTGSVYRLLIECFLMCFCILIQPTL